MQSSVKRFVRYEHRGEISYGILRGEDIAQIEGGLFGGGAETGKTLGLGEVRLLWPCEPSKIMAVGLNYRSHLGDRSGPRQARAVLEAALLPARAGGRHRHSPGAPKMSISRASSWW